MSSSRIDFYLGELAEEIIKDKMKVQGLEYPKDFDKYFQSCISKEMMKREFESCDETTSRIQRKNFKKPLSIKKTSFIQCLATKNNTTLSNVVLVLLVKGE